MNEVIIPARRSGHVLSTPMRVAVIGSALLGRRELRTYVEQRLLSTLGHLTRHVDCVAVQGERIEAGPSKARCASRRS